MNEREKFMKERESNKMEIDTWSKSKEDLIRSE